MVNSTKATLTKLLTALDGLKLGSQRFIYLYLILFVELWTFTVIIKYAGKVASASPLLIINDHLARCGRKALTFIAIAQSVMMFFASLVIIVVILLVAGADLRSDGLLVLDKVTFERVSELTIVARATAAIGSVILQPPIR